MLKHVAILMTFAVLSVGCAKLPFSTVDSSEPTPVTDDRDVRIAYEQTEPAIEGSAGQEFSTLKLPKSPMTGFLFPETKPVADPHDWRTMPQVPANPRTPATFDERRVCPPSSNPVDACAPPPLCAPAPAAVPGN